MKAVAEEEALDDKTGRKRRKQRDPKIIEKGYTAENRPVIVLRSQTPEDARLLKQYIGQYAIVEDVSPNGDCVAVAIKPALPDEKPPRSLTSPFAGMTEQEMTEQLARMNVPVRPGMSRGELERLLSLFDPDQIVKAKGAKKETHRAGVTGGMMKSTTSNDDE